MNKFNKDVKSYFTKVADCYDNTNEKLTWKLCDEIIKHYLTIEINTLNDNACILDVGCGTGTWSNYVATLNSSFEVTAIDNNSAMLKYLQNNKKSNVNIINSNAITYKYDKDFYDLIICFYVLPFIQDFNLLLSNLETSLKSGGKMIIVSQNLYETLSLQLLSNSLEEVKNIIEHKSGTIHGHPKMSFHTSHELNATIKKNKLLPLNTFSFPSLAPIGYREKVTGENNSLADILGDSNKFDIVKNFEIEMIERYRPQEKGLYIMNIISKL